MEIIARNLRNLRKEKGIKEDRNISQREVAEAIGVNPSTLTAWENKGCISFAGAWKLADYYGVNLGELAGRPEAVAR